jgi:glycosyltransferase involved in cell wall biosynthesis
MKILTALTYYRPHISGLTIYAERLCEALVRRGHLVTVLTSQYEAHLPLREDQNGVDIFRVPVAARVSKGVLMPTIGWHATRLAQSHDILHLHLPQLDAAGIALRGRFFHHPVVLTYHSDLTLPPSAFHWLVKQVNFLANQTAVRLSNKVVTNTLDFAENSPFLCAYLPKVQAILPPVEITPPTPQDCADLRQKFNLPPSGPFIGIVARLSSEKGFEVLLQALPIIRQEYPTALILHVGPREPVGEAAYARLLAPYLQASSGHYRQLGTLTPAELAAFYAVCDVNVLPSINNTETFGMVQVEAALCGTPTVASDLPGVRTASRETGMGRTVPSCDADALARAICAVLCSPDLYPGARPETAQKFSPDTIAAQYENLFEGLLRG